MDDAIRHWVTVVAPTETGAEEIEETIQELEDFFYADNGLVVLPQPERLQRVFNGIIYLFNQIGLQTNVQKTVSMAYRPLYTPGGLLELEYMRRVMGVGSSY